MNTFPLISAIEAGLGVMDAGSASERVLAEKWRQEMEEIINRSGSIDDGNKALVALLNRFQPIADQVERARWERQGR